MWQMEMKKRGRRKGEGLALMEECLFYSDNNMVQKVCMRHGQKWMAAATTRCAEVKETWGRRRQKVGLCCTGERWRCSTSFWGEGRKDLAVGGKTRRRTRVLKGELKARTAGKMTCKTKKGREIYGKLIQEHVEMLGETMEWNKYCYYSK